MKVRKDYSFFTTKASQKNNLSTVLSIIENGFRLKKGDLLVKKNDKGKPYLYNNGYLFGSISIAHTSTRYVLLFCQKTIEIGVDAEYYIQNEVIARGFLSQLEYDYVTEVTEKEQKKFLELATTIWTLKEAFVKALGVGFVTHPKNICVADLLTKKRGGYGEVSYLGRSFLVNIIEKRRFGYGVLSAVAIVKKENYTS
jgi:phosphopantetheinyl transferase